MIQDDTNILLEVADELDKERKEALKEQQFQDEVEMLIAKEGMGPTRAPLEPFMRASELFDKQFPDTPWQIEGLLPNASVATIGGIPKTSKTWVALEMAISIATGSDALGHFKVKGQGSAALFLAEDDQRSTRNRLRSIAAFKGLNPKDAVKDIYVHNRKHIHLSNDNDFRNLIVICKRIPNLKCVILDPLRDLHNTDENSSTEMSFLGAKLRALRNILNCTVIFVHHMGKIKDSGSKRGGQLLRGSTALHGLVDAGIYLLDLETDERTFWTNQCQVELKSAQSAGKFSLKLEVSDNEIGEAVNVKWTVAQETAEIKKQIEEQRRAAENAADKVRIINLINEYFDPKDPKPWSGKKLDAILEMRNGRAAQIMEQLQLEGLVKEIWEGKKFKGWVLISKLNNTSPLPTSPRET